MRTRTLLLSALVVTVLPIWIAELAAGGSPRGSSPNASTIVRASTPASRALGVLRDWDHRRSVAWSRGDPVALAGLYTRRSRTGSRDVTDLRQWRRRGLQVAGLRQQVSAVRLATSTARELVLVVTDRTVDGVAVDGSRRTPLPRSAWVTHRITLRHSAGGWRVVDARVEPEA